MKEASFAALPPSSQPKLDGLSNKITVLFDIATQLSAHPEDALPGVISGPTNTDGLFINAFGALKTESDLEMEADLIDLVTIYWTDKIVTTASLIEDSRFAGIPAGATYKVQRDEFVKAAKLAIFHSLVALSKVVNRKGLTDADKTWQEKEADVATKLRARVGNETGILGG